MTWNVKIGVNPIGWMNDDLPSLGGDTPLETALKEGKEIGYEGFELGNKFPKDGPSLKAKLDAFGLTCVSGWYTGFLAELESGQNNAQAVAAEVQRCKTHMEKLQHNGVKVAVYGECTGTVQGQIDTPVSRRPQFANEDLWKAFAERLNAFGEHLLTTYGLKLAYHHHVGSYVESPADIDKLMELTDPAKVFLLFDTGHAYFGGALDPNALLKKHVKRVAHVHCKDVRTSVIAQARNDNWSFLNGVINGTFTVPGDGDMDFKAILSTLRSAGYEGWLVVEAEQDPAVAPSYQYAQMGYKTLRTLVEQLGSRVSMTRPLLVKAASTGRDIVNVTPERAGWTHVGFRAQRLSKGETETLKTGARELCLVVLTGTIDLTVGGKTYTGLGVRKSVFEKVSPAAVYIPTDSTVHISAVCDTELALCTAPGDSTARAVRVIDSAAMRHSVRGKGSNTRYVCDILPHDDTAAAHLLVVEVLTPAGHSSSYPPHKHDVELPPTETQLEETYYHRLNPPQGFAFQRVYTDDRSLDEAYAVENHDVVMVPRGYHPVVAPHGYDLYYLNVMAGPNRFWIFKNDPAHEWMLAPDSI